MSDIHNIVIQLIEEPDQTYKVMFTSPIHDAAAVGFHPFKSPMQEEDLRSVRSLLVDARTEHMQYMEFRAKRENLAGTRTAAEHLSVFGKKLYESIFSESAKKALAECHRRADGKIRIRLVLPPALSGLPWELMHSPDQKPDQGWLFRGGEYLLSRSLPKRTLEEPLKLTNKKLNILIVVANPTGDLNAQRERDNLIESLASLEALDSVDIFQISGPDTIVQLGDILSNHKINVLHFIGHGSTDNQDSYIHVEDNNGDSFLLSSRLFIDYLKHPSLRLVVLNACRTAQQTTEFTSMACAILETSRVPAVVAMQFPITDEAAIVFTPELYKALRFDIPLDGAIANARLRMNTVLNTNRPPYGHHRSKTMRELSANPESRGKQDVQRAFSVEWCTPVLFMNSRDGRLFEMHQPDPKEIFNKAENCFEEGRMYHAFHLYDLVKIKSKDRQLTTVAYEKRTEASRKLGIAKRWVHVNTLKESQCWEALEDAVDDLIELSESDTEALLELKKTAKQELEGEQLLEAARTALSKGDLKKAKGQLKKLLPLPTECKPNATAIWSRLDSHQKQWEIRKEIDDLEAASESGGDVDYVAMFDAVANGRDDLKAHPDLDSDANNSYGPYLREKHDLATRHLGWEEKRKEILELIEKFQLDDALGKIEEFRSGKPVPPKEFVDDLDKAIDGLRKQIEQALKNLKRVKESDCFWDSELFWPEGYPYEVLADLGAYPSTTLAKMKAMDGISGRATSAGLGDACKQLTHPKSRLWVDNFLAEFFDPEGLLNVFNNLSESTNWPDEERIRNSLLPCDFVLALLVLGQRTKAIEVGHDLLCENPGDFRLAHHLALMTLVAAEKKEKDDDDREGLETLWEKSIAYWGMTLANEDFWSLWQKRRKECYGQEISQDEIKAVRDQHASYIPHRIVEHQSRHDADSAAAEMYHRLQQKWDLEFISIASLRKIGGIQVSSDAVDFVAGPLAVNFLRLNEQISAKMVHAVTSEDDAPFWCRCCYSQLGPAASYSRLELAARAIEELGSVACEQCAAGKDAGDDPQHTNMMAGRTCSLDCANFDLFNPAYSAFDNKYDVFVSDMSELLRRGHLSFALSSISLPQPDIKTAQESWAHACDFAKHNDKVEATESEITEQALGRGRGLKEGFLEGDLDSDEKLVLAADVLKAAMEVVSGRKESELLSVMLGDLLKNRGVFQANIDDDAGALDTLREAFKFNPESWHTRTELCVAMVHVAREYPSNQWRRASALLRESLELGIASIRMFPMQKRLPEVLSIIATAEHRINGELSKESWEKTLRVIEELIQQSEEADVSSLSTLIQQIRYFLYGEAPPMIEQLETKEIDEIISAARSYQRNGELTSSIEKWWEAVQMEPQDNAMKGDLVDVIIELSNKLQHESKFNEAFKLVDDWMNKTPDSRALAEQREIIRTMLELMSD